MKIIYSFPSRSRPEKFKACMENIKEMSDDSDYTVLVKGDSDDASMNNADMWNWLSKNHYGHYVNFWEHSKNKIHAMNRNLDFLVPGIGDIIIGMSDDMKFTERGFDNIIRKDMRDHFPDLDGVLHYNDGMQKSNVMTMSIMGREYFNRTGYIYHPEYASLWCDVEATEVAFMLDRYKYMSNDNIIFRHMHPVWKLAEWDEQYRKSESADLYAADKAVILARRARKYDLDPSEIINGFKYPDAL